MFACVPAGAELGFFEQTDILKKAACDQFYAQRGLHMGGEEPIAHMALETRGLSEAIGVISSINSANLPSNFSLIWIINTAGQPDIQPHTSFDEIKPWRAIEAEQIALVKLDLGTVLIRNGV